MYPRACSFRPLLVRFLISGLAFFDLVSSHLSRLHPSMRPPSHTSKRLSKCSIFRTPLLLVEVIAVLLLERGVDTKPRSSKGETSLYMASYRRCADVMVKLIGHGGDLNVGCEDFDPFYEDVMWTPLQVAISEGSFPVTMSLLQHGANPNALDNLGKTALHLASYRRGIREVELLLKYGANMDVRDKKGWAPLHEAAYLGPVQVVVVLLNRGADPHVQTYDGKTRIQLASTPASCISEESQAQTIRLFVI